MSRTLSRPIVSLTDAMTRLAARDDTTDIPACERTDEIGEMARAVTVFKENLQRRNLVGNHRRQAGIHRFIAGAVEEQGAATQEIARNVREVSEDAKTVQESIVDVSRSSASSYGSAIKVMWAAKDLREPARRLGEEVDSFVATIRQGSSAA